MTAKQPATGGASSSMMVGNSNFKRHNPRSDRFAILNFDHLEVYTTDATSSARRFAAAFGFQMLAVSDLEMGNQRYLSIVCGSGSVRFVFTSPFWTDAPPSAQLHFQDPFPTYDQDEALAFVRKHGVAVKAVALQVSDAAEAYRTCLANGGVGVTEPTTISDEDGTIVYSEVIYYEDIKLRWIQGRDTYKGAYMPGYKATGRPCISFGLERIDHVVSNVPVLGDVVKHLQRMLGFHEFSEFTAEDVGTVDSGLNSMVMANNDETVLLPVNEPTFGTRRKSQIQSYLEHNRGSGVQHIAIQTKDILSTVRRMAEQSPIGGVEFMPHPGKAYYAEHVPAKMGSMVSAELIADCDKYGILIDRDDEGGLLQIFTAPLHDRPTLFVEIIQRLGCPLPNGGQKPACGGFGKGNFGALFKCIEDWEKKRDGETD